MLRPAPLLMAALVLAAGGCQRNNPETSAASAPGGVTPSTATPPPGPAPGTTTTGTSPGASGAGMTGAPSGSVASAAQNAGTPVATANSPAGGQAGGLGQTVYGQVCAVCHAAGVTGAPKPGDKADWAPRVAQGKDTLYAHAINGYQGSKGVMPPRGGSSKSDDEVRAAVDYMVSQAQ
jgi:cytochrome c5